MSANLSKLEKATEEDVTKQCLAKRNLSKSKIKSTEGDKTPHVAPVKAFGKHSLPGQRNRRRHLPTQHRSLISALPRAATSCTDFLRGPERGSGASQLQRVCISLCGPAHWAPPHHHRCDFWQSSLGGMSSHGAGCLNRLSAE